MSALRRAVRSLVATPSATALTILTLSLGIGGSTVMLSITEALLVRPPSLREPGQLLMVWEPALRIAGLVGACMLAIGCLNAVNLLLARALAGQRELGVRLALGASTPRLLWPVLLESLLIGGLSGVLGVAFAAWTLDTSHATLQTMLGTSRTLTLNGRVMAGAVVLVATCSLTCGIVPAWLATRRASLEGLREGRTLPSSRGVARARGLLVLTEVALATALLVTTGLIARSYWRLLHTDPGFDASQVVTLRAAPTGSAYEDDAGKVAYFDGLQAALRRVPGVTAAGAISWRPMTIGSTTSCRVAGSPVPGHGREPITDVRVVTPGLFESLRIPLRHGRPIAASDDGQAPLVAVVNESFARAYGGGTALLDREAIVSCARLPTAHRATIVGIVGDVRLRALDTPARPTIYLPLAQRPTSAMTLTTRVEGDTTGAVETLRQAAEAVDSRVPVTDVEALDAVVAASIVRPRQLLTVLGAGTLVALVLALIGLYGVLTHDVRQRAREIGLRMAVGASPRQILRLVAVDGALLLAIGCGVGIALSSLVGTAIEGQLFEVSKLDVLTYTLVPILFSLVGMAAMAVPAWRAARLDPAQVLRQQ